VDNGLEALSLGSHQYPLQRQKVIPVGFGKRHDLPSVNEDGTRRTKTS